MGDTGYSASPTNTAKSRGKQVRGDDGFHSRPPRPERNWLRKAASAIASRLPGFVLLGASSVAGEATGMSGAQEPRLVLHRCLAATACIKLVTPDLRI